MLIFRQLLFSDSRLDRDMYVLEAAVYTCPESSHSEYEVLYFIGGPY